VIWDEVISVQFSTKVYASAVWWTVLVVTVPPELFTCQTYTEKFWLGELLGRLLAMERRILNLN